MKIIQTITPDEMVSIFLRAEINSARWSAEPLKKLEEMGLSRKIVDNPNLADPAENKARATILKEYRGYGNNENIFQDLPTDITWKKVILTKQEFLKIKYMDYSYWVELSKGTRLPSDAATMIKQGIEIFDESNEGFINASKALNNGIKFPQLILVARDERSNLVVFEGHLRITAYALAPESIPEESEVIVGFSPNIANWGSY